MKQAHSWEITDAFWEAAQPLIPKRERDSNKTYQRKPGGGRRPMEPRTVLEAIFYVLVERPDISERPQHVCLDRGYAGEPALEKVVLRGFVPHIKSRGEEKTEKTHNPGHKARRWVVEAAHSWINRFRKLLIRFEKLTTSYLGLLSVKRMLFKDRL